MEVCCPTCSHHSGLECKKKAEKNRFQLVLKTSKKTADLIYVGRAFLQMHDRLSFLVEYVDDQEALVSRPTVSDLLVIEGKRDQRCLTLECSIC